ncbi:MAG: zf-HC2 domain-containing protein [Gemmatimonadetes bacterium]|nr:zf-HC2 domain-containing protein [Gemmatimonadota bacterium]
MSSHAFWTDRLSAHLDGLLSPDESDAMAQHLAGCAGCRTVAEELEEVRRRARALGGVEPSRDLWPAIRARLDAEPDVVDLTLHLDGPLSPAPAPAPRGSLLRVAATVALLVATGAAGWALRGATGGAATQGSAESSPAGFASTGGAGSDALGTEVSTLERLLSNPPEGMGAETVAVLRSNLVLIQRAVAESRAALEQDPDNSYVRSHLEGAMARQAAFVRQASQILVGDD